MADQDLYEMGFEDGQADRRHAKYPATDIADDVSYRAGYQAGYQAQDHRDGAA